MCLTVPEIHYLKWSNNPLSLKKKKIYILSLYHIINTCSASEIRVLVKMLYTICGNAQPQSCAFPLCFTLELLK